MMSLLIDIVYIVMVATIRLYKWCELGILTLLSSHLQKLIVSYSERNFGIIFQLPGKPAKKISKEEEERILAQCGYSSLCHVKVNNLSLFPRFPNQFLLAIGEGYMNKDWVTLNGEEEISEIARRLLEKKIYRVYLDWWPLNRFLYYMEFRAFNLQTVGKVFEVAEKHYDLGNELFESFLDPWMQYTCGYWANANNLNDAQVAKMELIAKKLDLKPGMRVLDVGCGWGMLCKYLAENYDVECVGISVGTEGIKYARSKCKGLKTEFRVQDYRDLNEKFDRIVSVGMFEHVGYHNYKTFFQCMNKSLVDDGIFLLHSIGTNHKDFPLIEPFFHKYVFPNGHFPYHRQITEKTEGLFIMLRR